MRIPTAFYDLSESHVTTHTLFCSLEASHQVQLQPKKGNYGPPHEEKETTVSFLNHHAPQSKRKTMSKGKSKEQNIANYGGGRSMTKNMGLELTAFGLNPGSQPVNQCTAFGKSLSLSEL